MSFSHSIYPQGRVRHWYPMVGQHHLPAERIEGLVKHHCNSKLLFPRRRIHFRRSDILQIVCVAWWRVSVVAFCIIFFGHIAVAQPPTKEQETVREPVSGATGSKSSPRSSIREVEQDALIADFFIASVELNAEVVGDRVKIDAAVELVINRDSVNGWHRVPLRFDQAHIWSREYIGPGEEAPDFYSKNGEEGIFWMLKGVGKHQLKFSMWVPVGHSEFGSRFALSLPPLPKLFETQFNFTIPEANPSLLSSPNLTVHETTHGPSETTFETSVTRNRLDVVWRIPRDTARKVSSVTTKFHLKPSPESILLVADQIINLQEPNSRELLIRLPSDFKLLERKGERIQSVTEVADRPGWIRVLLTKGTGRIDLRWIFRKPMSKDGERLTIQGLEVEGAAQQGGSVRIDDISGYRILPQISDSRMIYRINTDEMQNGPNDSSNSVFEFLQQPFRLVHEIRPIEPLHSVTPIYEFKIHSDFMELLVHQLIEVERGEVSELRFEWSKFESQNWNLIGSETASLTFGEIKTSKDNATNEIALKFSDPLPRGERIHLITRFERPITLNQISKLSWTLPEIPDRFVRGELIVTELDDDLELVFDESTEVKLSPVINENQINQLADLWDLEEPLRASLRSTSTKIVKSSTIDQLSATITRHERRVSGGTTVEIQEATPRDLLVNQQCQLDIQYGRLQSLDFLIPKDLMNFIRQEDISESLDIRLEGERLEVELIGGVPKIIFPRSIIGKNTIEIRYRYPIHVGDGQQSLELPIISFTESPFNQVKCLVTPIENVQVEQKDSGWIAIHTSPRGALWLKNLEGGPVESIPLTIGGALADTSQQYIVERADLWTQFEVDGRSQSLARYEVLSPPSRVLMNFAPGTKIKHVIVDGQSLNDTEFPNLEGQVIITLPDAIHERREIVIYYDNESESIFKFANLHAFHFPEFSESVWVDETVWELQLPIGQHLFGYPELKPLFGWKRKGLIWERESNETYLSERKTRWDSIDKKFHFNENFYAFRGFAPIQEVKFRSMNRSLILLIGAGFALGMGFIFFRFPVTRNVFSLFVTAFAFAVASLWYLEPMLLLLQPAIIGMLLALTATVIDVRTRKKFFDNSTMLHRVQQNDSHVTGVSSPDEGTTRIYSQTGSSVSNLSRK